jgi:6-pyruvoyltetrahydropterin/6-carboxytetrahydropterin synthase
MRFRIKRSFHFYAAHRNHDVPAAHKCFNIHGHTFFLDCYFGFDEQNEAGVTMLFSDIEATVLPVLADFDHALILNREDPIATILGPVGIKLCLLDCPPSSENLARALYERISEAVPMTLLSVDFRETTSSSVTYSDPSHGSLSVAPRRDAVIRSEH